MEIEPPAGNARVSFDGPMQLGASEFTIQGRGLANVGMLPDFVQTLRKLGPSGDDSADRMFRSAEDTIRLWEKVFAATQGPGQWAPVGVSQLFSEGKKLIIGPKLPSWWGTRAPSLQLTDSAANSYVVLPPILIHYVRDSDGLEGDIAIATQWSSTLLPEIALGDSLELEFVSGPAWARLTQW